MSQCAKKEEDSGTRRLVPHCRWPRPRPLQARPLDGVSIRSDATVARASHGHGHENAQKREAVAASPVASMLEFDAPIELTMQRVAFVGSMYAIIPDAPTAATGSAQKAQEDHGAVIKAVVGDLRSKLTELSQQQPVWRPVAPLA